MIKIPELDIEVEDVSEFNDEASEILGHFSEIVPEPINPA